MRTLIISILIVALMPTPGQAQTRSEKRGIGYGYHTPQDMEALSKGVSWWYNWYQAPDNGVKWVYKDYAVEFVPMVWGGSWSQATLNNTLENDPEIRYLLGFNEPNFKDQANMTPVQAAARWPELEAIATGYGLELIGPAVNYCGNCVSENGTTYSDPVEYLDAFFEACKDCRVDYIAVHWYGCGGLEWYLSLFEKYNKPIWVTEFACWDNAAISLEQQKSFLINAVEHMENNPNVFRYAWFAGRADGPNISLLGQNGQLTELGELYVNMPVHDPAYHRAVPARIQGQDYQQMQGIQLEATEDESGLLHVGSLDAGDWLAYNIDVAEGQEWYLSLRVAGTQTGSLEVILDEALVTQFSIAQTAGWQSWQTVDQQLIIPSGKHTLRLKVLKGGFNLNWLEISGEKPGTVTGLEQGEILQQAYVFPNPGNGRRISVNAGAGLAGKTLVAEIHSASGFKVLEVKATVNQSDLLEIEMSSALVPGLYLLKLENGKEVKHLKFIVQ
ncbi:glycosyl hydrolase [Cesiribacter sp. SM1]|uniref:glycosyl hydrolase n=1 Tax=Cesiribacter sp. SM1 TaxID=2861196 RepID=UPI001CD56ACD|nr:glycosyl hydrolase [Cesiribacter sp. SM1]